jgi:hypothetical protein
MRSTISLFTETNCGTTKYFRTIRSVNVKSGVRCFGDCLCFHHQGVDVISVVLARSSGQHLMMETETVSETSDSNSTLTWRPIAREDLVVYCLAKGFKSYITVEHIPDSHTSPSIERVTKLISQQAYAYAYSIPKLGLKMASYRTRWSRCKALKLVFGRCSVRISAGTSAVLRFRGFPQSPRQIPGQ